MLSPREQLLLQGIESGLRDSDPSFARRLQDAPSRARPARRPTSLRQLWLLMAIVPIVAGLVAVRLSHPVWGLVGFLVSVGVGLASLVCVPRDRFTRHG